MLRSTLSVLLVSGFLMPSNTILAQLEELPCICELMASLEIVPADFNKKIIITKEEETENISWNFEIEPEDESWIYESEPLIETPIVEEPAIQKERNETPRQRVQLNPDRPRKKRIKPRIRKRKSTFVKYKGQCPDFRK